MEEILGKLKSVYEECLKIKNELTSKQAQVVEISNQQKIFAEELKKQQASLYAREEAIKSSEDINNYRLEAEKLMTKAEASIKSFEERMRIFNEHSLNTNKELDAKKEALDIREKNIGDKENKLEALILEKVKSILKQ